MTKTSAPVLHESQRHMKAAAKAPKSSMKVDLADMDELTKEYEYKEKMSTRPPV